MGMKKQGEATSGHPIAERLVAKMTRRMRGKGFKLKEVIAGRAAAEEGQEKVVTPEELAGFDPAHAAYVYAQNQVSVMSELLTGLPEMAPFADIFSEAEDLYMPKGPPISPLTASYFTWWAFFDACAGPPDETIGTAVLEVGAAFGMHPELLRIIRLMQESRMGLYINKGTDGRLVVLEDIVTGAERRSISPAGYRGRKGELWYVRILPPPIHGSSEHVLFTTPYVVLQPGLRDWLAYFSRTLPANQPARIADYERHMKYGPTRTFWNDFVFEAYTARRSSISPAFPMFPRAARTRR